MQPWSQPLLWKSPAVPPVVPFASVVLLLGFDGVATTFNPADKSTNITLSNGNLTATLGTSGNSGVRSIGSLNNGLAYFEITATNINSAGGGYNAGFANTVSTDPGGVVANAAGAFAVGFYNGIIAINATNVGNLGSGFANGDVACIAVDFDNKKAWVRKNGGLWNNDSGANPATGANGFSFSTMSGGGPYYAYYGRNYPGDSGTINLGASAFAQAVPQGFHSWNDAPAFTDLSSHAHGGGNGTAQLSYAQKKFGVSSLQIAPTLSWAVRFTDSPDWKLSNSNSDLYTIEGWVRLNAFTYEGQIIGQWSSSDSSWSFRVKTNGELVFYTTSTGSPYDTIATTGAGMVINTWYHVAVSKDAAGKVRVFCNGVMVGSATPANSAHYDSTQPLSVGTDPGNNGIDGFIDEVRLLKGYCVYPSDSGFTVPTSIFPRS